MIDIVTHCYAKTNSQYAAFLQCQLSSLVLYPQQCNVVSTICYVRTDRHTKNVIRYFSKLGKPNLRLIPLSKREIGRRAIGRNIAAKTTEADIVWFTDVDYYFYKNCLDYLSGISWSKNVVLYFPKRFMIHKSHALGSVVCDDVFDKGGLIDIDTTQFTHEKPIKAIGGIQIVQGDFARKYGYLSKHKRLLKPVNVPFKSFMDDVIYRRFCVRQGKISRISIPNIYRFRHFYK